MRTNRFFLTSPWRGEVDRPKAGRVGVIFFHPTPLASLATLPLQGRV